MSAFSERIIEKQIPKEAYKKYSAEIAEYNLRALQQISFVGMVGGIVLVIASLPPIQLLSMLRGYLSIAVLFAVIFALTCTVLKKHEKAVLPAYYVLIVLMVGISVLMGTVWERTTNATTFVMLILMLPMLIIDKPARLSIVFGVLCIIFCAVDLQVKSGKLLDLDIANCIVFYMLSVILSRQTIGAKMNDIIIKDELKRQRDMDSLTKLNNRGAFERIVERYVQTSDKDAVLLIMDIDNFKSVNDTMGHAYGDEVLRLVGEQMRNTFRSGDVVSRFGGDEFVAFLPAAGDTETVLRKAGELAEKIAKIEIESETSCKIGASIGASRFPRDGNSFEELYKKADAALYRAKESGKGRCAVYEDAK